MSEKLEPELNIAPFTGSCYDHADLGNLFDQALSTIASCSHQDDQHGIITFVTNDDAPQSPPTCVVNCPSGPLEITPEVTDALSAYRSYLVRCTKPGGSITVPSSPDVMIKQIWSAFATTVVASVQPGGDVRSIPLLNLSDILIRAYGYPKKAAAYPILVCKINYSVKNNTVKTWDIVGAYLSDFPQAPDEKVSSDG